jgi:hypothetical protein
VSRQASQPTGVYGPRVKRPLRRANHSPLSSVKHWETKALFLHCLTAQSSDNFRCTLQLLTFFFPQPIPHQHQHGGSTICKNRWELINVTLWKLTSVTHFRKTCMASGTLNPAQWIIKLRRTGSVKHLASVLYGTEHSFILRSALLLGESYWLWFPKAAVGSQGRCGRGGERKAQRAFLPGKYNFVQHVHGNLQTLYEPCEKNNSHRATASKMLLFRNVLALIQRLQHIKQYPHAETNKVH